jgi:hypothetical protein
VCYIKIRKGEGITQKEEEMKSLSDSLNEKKEIALKIIAKVEAQGFEVISRCPSVNGIFGFSYYVTFKTPSNGNFMIRLSDHDTGVNRAVTENQYNYLNKITAGEMTIDEVVRKIITDLTAPKFDREAYWKACKEKNRQEAKNKADQYTVNQIIEIAKQNKIKIYDTNSVNNLKISSIAKKHLHNLVNPDWPLHFTRRQKEELGEYVADVNKAIESSKVAILKFLEVIDDE